MSKVSLNPMDLLRRSKTGTKIADEIEAVDETAEQRKADAKAVADADAKLADARRTLREADRAERAKVAAAKAAYKATVDEARRPSVEARGNVARLERQRNVAAKQLAHTADPRIETFRFEMWQHFQNRRGNVRQIAEDRQTNRVNKATNLPITHVWHNGNAIARWSQTIRDVLAKCQALKLEPLTEAEIPARLAALKAEVEGVEARISELTGCGPSPGEDLSLAITTAPTIQRGPKQQRYQTIDD